MKVGDTIYVSGTTAIDESGQITGVGDAYAQAIQALKNIEKALAAAGVSLDHVVQTRIYLTDIGRADEVARAHLEFFGNVKPAATMIEVQRLVDQRMLVEIEAVAIL